MNSRWILLSLAWLILPGCASVKVESDSVESNAPLDRPSVIYVQQFDTSRGTWDVACSGPELDEFKRNAASELQQMMIERFPEIAPTQAAPTPLPSSGLLVTGEFLTVKGGNRALRMGIGFGAGGTKVETFVRIYDLARSSTQPAVSFKTTGGSNAEPGWLGGGVVSAASNATGLQTDWERTAREIRNFILDQSGR
jgi:hypothetical protein